MDLTRNRKNIVLIHLDTLRPDHLGCYGYGRATSPNIDKIAREGVLFTKAYSTDVPTVPYYTSMFTGRRGTTTGVVWTEDLSGEIPLFTRALAGEGILTTAVSTMSSWKPWLTRDFHLLMNPVAGQPGRIQQVDAEEINRFALSFLRQYGKRDFFLWLHYWDVHTFYWPPEKYRSLFDEDDGIPANYHEMDWSRSQHFLPEIKDLWEKIFHHGFIYLGLSSLRDVKDFWKKRASKEFEYKLLVSLYDGEIAYVDECVGAFMRAIQEHGLEDKTMVMISADHGESHGEHDTIFNHVDLYEPTVHVPLIIKDPSGLPAGVKFDELVQNIDLVPTILDIFNVDKPPELEGVSLLPRLTGESSDPIRKEVFCDTGLAQCARMISDGKWKLIETIHRGLWEKPSNPELYNLEKDTLEKENLSLVEKKKADELQLRLHRSMVARLDGRPDPLRLVAEKDPPQMIRAMRRLGITHQDLKAFRERHGIRSVR